MKDLVVLTVLLERVNEETRVREIIREKLLSSQGDEKEKKPSFTFSFLRSEPFRIRTNKDICYSRKKSQQLFQNSKREDKAGSRR